MIKVTRLDNSKVMVNVEKIQSLKATPDTLITFTNDVRMMVREPVEELSRKIIEYQRKIHNDILIDPRIFEDPPQTLN